MRESLITLVSALFGTFGFSILFSVKPRRLFWTVLGGGLTWILFLAAKPLGLFNANLIAAFCMTLYCEAAARWQKAPVITFLTPAVVVLVPGGSLYYMIAALLAEEYLTASEFGLKTAGACLGITAGILLASLCAGFFFRFRRAAGKPMK